MSRRPDPLEKRIGKGNSQRRPLPQNAPVRVEGIPEPPEWMTGHGLACWRKTATLLAERGQLSQDSELSLVALCVTYDEWCTLAEDLRVNGRFQLVRTKAGAGSRSKAARLERVRPAVSAFQDADRRLRAWLTEFGLTDASRGKVSAQTPGDEHDPLRPYDH